MIPGVALSFLSKEEQEETYHYLASQHITPSITQAEKLKEISQTGEWQQGDFGTLHQTFWQQWQPKGNIKIKYDKIKEFFKAEHTAEDIEEEIIKALEFYRKKG